MEVRGRHVVVTGGAGGIGAAVLRRFAAEGARALVVADRDAAGAERVAEEVGGLAVGVDVSAEDGVRALIREAEERHGPIDVFFSNAGIVGALGGPEVDDETFVLTWRLHVMAHVWAARALLPAMLERGEGYLLNTASAAGLLSNVRAVAYTASKHAAVAVAEWLSIAYADRGVRSSCLCPLAVRTALLLDDEVSASELASGPRLEPEAVAAAVVEGMREERCLILPHPEVATYAVRRAADHERWLRGMRGVEARIAAAGGGIQV
jgi:NAD(P)-dependent dehydrogenase (short-subunit alcohol dehydrogenase family)